VFLTVEAAIFVYRHRSYSYHSYQALEKLPGTSELRWSEGVGQSWFIWLVNATKQTRQIEQT
jgi:hypothetical protein